MSAAPQKYPAMPVTPSGPAAAWLRPIGETMSFDSDLKHLVSLAELTKDERVVRMCVAGHAGEILRRLQTARPEEQRWMPFAAGPIPGRGQILVTDGSAVYNMDCADIAAFQEVGDKLTHWARMIEPFPPQRNGQS